MREGCLARVDSCGCAWSGRHQGYQGLRDAGRLVVSWEFGKATLALRLWGSAVFTVCVGLFRVALDVAQNLCSELELVGLRFREHWASDFELGVEPQALNPTNPEP